MVRFLVNFVKSQALGFTLNNRNDTAAFSLITNKQNKGIGYTTFNFNSEERFKNCQKITGLQYAGSVLIERYENKHIPVNFVYTMQQMYL